MADGARSRPRNEGGALGRREADAGQPEKGRPDAGQILPLAIGFSVIALSLIVVVVAISSVYLTQKRLYALADSAALSAADSFEPTYSDEPEVVLGDRGVRREAEEYLDAVGAASRFDRLRVAEPTGSDDGVSAQVTLKAVARPALVSPLFPAGISISVSSAARGGLREE